MRIKCAAILHEDVIYEGRSHAEIGWRMIDEGHCPKPFPAGDFQAFVTDGGNFVGRKVAMVIAIAAGQVVPTETCNSRDLYSEDLIHSKVWDYPYKERYTSKAASKQIELPIRIVPGPRVFNTMLVDQMSDDSTPQLKTSIETHNGQIFINADGYGDYCSMNGKGNPIIIELANGVLRVVVWSDINKEDHTHIITLENAKESNRIESE